MSGERGESVSFVWRGVTEGEFCVQRRDRG